MDAPYAFAIIPITLLPIIVVDEDKKFIEKILPRLPLGINSPNNPSLRVRMFIIEKLNKTKKIKLIIFELLCAKIIMLSADKILEKKMSFVLFLSSSPMKISNIVDMIPPAPIAVNKSPTPVAPKLNFSYAYTGTNP